MELLCPTQDRILTRQWYDALRDVVIRHHDPLVRVVLILLEHADHPSLQVEVRNCIDTGAATESRLEKLVISTVALRYFPGVQLAREWLACAWAGYIQHETLELVTLGGDPTRRVIDPHCGRSSSHRLSPYHHDRGLRDGLPTELTPVTLQRTLATVMDL